VAEQLDAIERAGRLVVRTGTREHAADSRRSALEIERGPLPFTLTPARITVIVIATTLSVGTFVVMTIAHATPLPCVGPLALLAGWALLAFWRGRRVLLQLGEGAITVSGPWSSERVAVDDVEELGVGDDAPYAALWIRVRGRGRVLLLDGLTREEADLASRKLCAVIAPST
jgi:hypothetical protein